MSSIYINHLISRKIMPLNIPQFLLYNINVKIKSKFEPVLEFELYFQKIKFHLTIVLVLTSCLKFPSTEYLSSNSTLSRIGSARSFPADGVKFNKTRKVWNWVSKIFKNLTYRFLYFYIIRSTLVIENLPWVS